MRFHVAVASALALFAFSTGASALEWHLAAPGTVFVGPPQDAARAYVAAHAGELELASVDLAPITVLPGRAGATVRFAQTHHGLPVFDASAAVRIVSGAEVAWTTLEVARDVAIATTPAVKEVDVRALMNSLRGTKLDGLLSVTLGVRFLGLAAPRLAYRAIMPSPEGGIRYDVDALTGNVIDSQNLGKNVTGRVYKISSAVTPTPTDEDLLDLDGTADRLNAFSGYLSSFEYVSGTPGGMAGMALVVAQDTAPDVSGNFTFDPPVDPLDEHDSFAVVNTYYHTHRMRNFFTTTLKVDMSASKWTLGAVANVLNADGSKLDNAAFSPTPIGAPWNKANTIIIGQGTMSDFAYDSDVFLHEFTHYVAHNAIDYSDGQAGADSYGLNTFPGSIDEGTADYFACTVNGDPVLGEASLGPLDAERDLSKDLVKCPDDIFGEVHADGEVIGSLTWKVRTILGPTRADPLIWSAMTMLTKSSSLGDLATGIVGEATTMQAGGDVTSAELTAIKAAVTDRGLDDCGRVLSLDTKNRKANLFGLDTLGQAFGADCATLQGFGLALNSLFHFSKTPSKSSHGVTFHVDLAAANAGNLKWAIYAKPDVHVGFAVSSMGLPEVQSFTYKVDGLTGTSGDLTIDEKSEPPFDATKTYYAVIVQQDCPDATATVSAKDIDTVPGTGGGGGAGGATSSTTGNGGAGGGQTATTDDGGCGCRTPSSSAPASAGGVGLLLAIAAMARRRRFRA